MVSDLTTTGESCPLIPETFLCHQPVGAAFAQNRTARMEDTVMIPSSGFEPPPIGGGWVVEESLFRMLLAVEIQKAQRLRYSISLVCLAAEGDFPGDGKPSLASIAERIARYLRGTDAVATWSEGWFALLLIDAETTNLPAILGRLTGRVETRTWSAGGSSYPRTAVRADDMLRQAVELLMRAKAEGGNRLY